jgi:hypothetical protein
VYLRSGFTVESRLDSNHNPFASAYQVLGLEACTTTSGYNAILHRTNELEWNGRKDEDSGKG